MHHSRLPVAWLRGEKPEEILRTADTERAIDRILKARPCPCRLCKRERRQRVFKVAA